MHYPYPYPRHLFSLALLLATSYGARAQRFDLDPSFGSGGQVTTVLDPVATACQVLELYPQADGKTIALCQLNSAYATVRYNADGTLDASYGTSGRIVFDLAVQRPGTSFTQANSPHPQRLLQADGKLLLIGQSGAAAALLRFNADGTMDAAFGSNGLLVRPLGAAEASSGFRSARLQPDGKIVTVGYSLSNGTASSGGNRLSLLVSRYTPNGTPEQEYLVNFPIAASRNDTEGFGLAIQPDGKILVSGRHNAQSAVPSLPARTVLVRLLPNLTPDPAFGSAGLASYSGLSYYTDNAQLLLLPGGSFVVDLGTAYTTVYQGTLARFLPSGALDSSFGINGVANFVQDSRLNGAYDGPYHVAGSYGAQLALQTDGKIVWGGSNGAYFGVLRVNTNGTKDAGFGGFFDNTIRTEFPDPTHPTAYRPAGINSIAVQADGKILAAGSASRSTGPVAPTTNPVLVLARYAATPTATRSGAWTGSVDLYPNPVGSGELQLRLSGLPGTSPTVEARLYNALGQLVRQHTLTNRAGAAQGGLAVRGLTPGVYTLRLTSGAQVSTHQVVVP